MSAIKDALDAIREAVRLTDEVKRTAGRISDLTAEMRDIDRRVSRLEGKWEAAIDLSRLSANRSSLPEHKKTSDKK
jgi:hypothetical protein